MMMAGSIISGTAILTSSLIKYNFWVYAVLYGFLNGFGMACLFLPALASIGYYFDVRVSIAMSLAFFGCSLGNIIFPPVEEVFIKRFQLRSTLILEGALVTAMLPLAKVLPGLEEVRRRQISLSWKKEKQQTEPNHSEEPSLALAKPKVDWFIMKKLEFCLYMTSQFFSGMAEWAPMGILPRLFKKTFDHSTSQSLKGGLLITTYGVAGLLVRVPMGAFADLPDTNPLVIQAFCGLVVSLAGFLQSIASEFWQLGLLTGVIGAFVPGIQPLNPSIVLDIWGIDGLAFVLGFVKFFRGIGYVFGPLLLNMAMDKFGEKAGLCTAAGFHLCGSAFAFICYVVNKKTNSDVQEKITEKPKVNN